MRWKNRCMTQENLVRMRLSLDQLGRSGERQHKNQVCESEFFVITMSFYSQLGCIASQHRFALSSPFCLTLVFSPDFAIYPILSDPRLLIYFHGHLGLAEGLESNHVTWWLEAQMQESEKTWDLALNIKLLLLCTSTGK